MSDGAPDTLDELTPVVTDPGGGLRPRRDSTGPVPRLAVGSDDHDRVGLDADYYDRDADDPRTPRNRDLSDRMSALERRQDVDGQRLAVAEQHVATTSLWTRRGVKALSLLAGMAGAAFAWALTCARADGDAEATERAREADRVWLLRTVRDDVIPRLAVLSARIDGLTETLRLYFPAGALRVHGPMPPIPPPGEP